MRISRRVLFSTLAAGLLGLLVLQPAPAGKGGGKGGGGDDPPADPPPVTYEIRWVENFFLNKGNHAGDLLGVYDSTDRFPYGIVYNGDFYPVELFFSDLDESARYTYGLSDRSEDGSIHLCGTCDTADGIRGCVMRLTPDPDGVLVRTDFSIAQPAPGDDISSLRNVNSSGEAVGYSRLSSLNEKIAIYHTSTDGTVPFAFDTATEHFISNTGRWTGTLFEADGIEAVYAGSPGGELQFLAAINGIRDVNNPGHFVGETTIAETTRKGTTYRSFNYFFDGTLSLLNEDAPVVLALNDDNDRLSTERITEKRNDPGYDSGLLYFADLDREVPINDMIDLNNTDADLARWFGTNSKAFIDVTNDGVIVGRMQSVDSNVTFVLVPVQP